MAVDLADKFDADIDAKYSTQIMQLLPVSSPKRHDDLLAEIERWKQVH